MTTELLYTDDSYLLDVEAIIQETSSVGDSLEVVLDRTVFYPQGGGQPSDTGTITVGGTRYAVSAVAYRDGSVVHTIDADKDTALAGQKAVLEIDRATRLRHARTHTAGHLVTHVLERALPTLMSIKGHHFPDAAYVEMVDQENVSTAELVHEMNSLLEAAIGQDLDVDARACDFDEIAALRPYLATSVPKDKPTRIVTIGDFVPVPCGGTHVSSTAELSLVRIAKVRRKKGRLKVSYEISP